MLGHVSKSISLPSGSSAGSELQAIFNYIYALGAGAWTIPRDGTLYSWAWGGGGGSNVANSSLNKSGGGGAAVFKKLNVLQGQIINYFVGSGGYPDYPTAATIGLELGQDSTVTFPNGTVITAGGGKGWRNSPPSGGIASGGDLNRNGGNGGPSSTAYGALSTAGQNGYPVYPSTSNNPSGGSSGGFEPSECFMRGGRGARGDTYLNGASENALLSLYYPPDNHAPHWPGGGAPGNTQGPACQCGAHGFICFELV